VFKRQRSRGAARGVYTANSLGLGVVVQAEDVYRISRPRPISPTIGLMRGHDHVPPPIPISSAEPSGVKALK
jgi:hypothetical protein